MKYIIYLEFGGELQVRDPPRFLGLQRKAEMLCLKYSNVLQVNGKESWSIQTSLMRWTAEFHLSNSFLVSS